jgi:hypothetical protein
VGAEGSEAVRFGSRALLLHRGELGGVAESSSLLGDSLGIGVVWWVVV